MEQRSKAERLLEDRKETITDVYDKIVELEKQISENTLEEPLEITKVKTVSIRTDEEGEKVFHAKYVEPEKFIGSQEEFNEIQQRLNEKKAEVENLIRLKSELERNLEEVTIR
ncbi:hypothetical protein X798_05015 [Onchocerca flexuosa]|uniref:Uncharacterized protein n=1 Tax=Onchocerca flexuosa TaxID=387005 RepID=A0A238BRK9_9BILA|nr:hypothetical protein X798_05015 [Onchocerca flexuosa]